MQLLGVLQVRPFFPDRAKPPGFSLQREGNLKEYTFNSRIAKHYFCKICGIKPFYIHRSNPDGWGINVNCFDEVRSRVKPEEFDGRNWEADASNLAYKNIS